MKITIASVGSLLLGAFAFPVTIRAAPALAASTSSIDEQGRIQVTRIVPVPATISPEAQAKLIHPPPSVLSSGASIAEQRAMIDARQARDAAECLKLYPAKVSEATMAGVPVHIVEPSESNPSKADRVLLNLHGGGFRTDTGSLLESIPIAHLARAKVVAVLYRLAPEHPFPAAVDDAVAVYRELLKTHAPEKIGIYGTSAGAILTAETAVKLKQLGLPLPALLGMFSAWGDFSKAGDSLALFGLQGLSGRLLPHDSVPLLPEYAGKTSPTDPVLSPVHADLRGMPPTLLITSTRDMLLSGTAILHRALLRAGNDARLIVFDALPHAFWLDVSLPESREALEMMAHFFDERL